MQQVVSPPRPPIYPNRNGNGGRSPSTRPQSIIIVAITLFALSGLLIGFAVGVLNRPKATQATVLSSKGSTPVVTQKAPPTATSAAVTPTNLNCPAISAYIGSVTPGNTYSITSSAIYQVKGPCTPIHLGKPVQVAGITFKLWLIKQLPSDKGITFSQTPSQILNMISTPLTGKTLDFNTGKAIDPDIPDLQLLTFGTTPQVQQSDTSGKVTWKYTIASSAPSGDYDLVILTDWNGRFYNWSWVPVEVKGSN